MASLIHPPLSRASGSGPGGPCGPLRYQRRAAHRRRPNPTARRRPALSDRDPNYDPDTDTYRQIFRGHDNASAVTNTEGLTVYFDPDTNEVLGFSIVSFSAYYEAHVTEGGDFEVSLPTKVPVNLEEEMDFDAEAIRSGVRIAEFY